MPKPKDQGQLLLFPLGPPPEPILLDDPPGGPPPTTPRPATIPETAAFIRHLLEDGYSLTQATATLNKLEVPTVSGRGRWHPSSLKALLKKETPHEK